MRKPAFCICKNKVANQLRSNSAAEQRLCFPYTERSTGWIAKVRELNVVAQKRPGRPKKTWNEVLVDDRKKLGMDFADPMNRSEWRGRL